MIDIYISLFFKLDLMILIDFDGYFMILLKGICYMIIYILFIIHNLWIRIIIWKENIFVSYSFKWYTKYHSLCFQTLTPTNINQFEFDIIFFEDKLWKYYIWYQEVSYNDFYCCYSFMIVTNDSSLVLASQLGLRTLRHWHNNSE